MDLSLGLTLGSRTKTGVRTKPTGGATLREQAIAAAFGAGQAGAFYDPSDLSTLFQDSAGTTPVTADGDPVGRILDLSGNDNHLTQATAGKRLTYRVDGGTSWIESDGVNDVLTCSLNLTGTDKVFCGLALRKLSDASARIPLAFNGNAPGGFYYAVPHSNGADSYRIVYRGSSVVTNTVAGYAAPITNVVSAVMDRAAPLLSLRVDGVANNVTTAVGAGNFANATLAVGANDAASAAPFNGRFCGIVISGALPTTAQINAIEAWLADKSGVTL